MVLPSQLPGPTICATRACCAGAAAAATAASKSSCRSVSRPDMSNGGALGAASPSTSPPSGSCSGVGLALPSRGPSSAASGAPAPGAASPAAACWGGGPAGVPPAASAAGARPGAAASSAPASCGSACNGCWGAAAVALVSVIVESSAPVAEAMTCGQTPPEGQRVRTAQGCGQAVPAAALHTQPPPLTVRVKLSMLAVSWPTLCSNDSSTIQAGAASEPRSGMAAPPVPSVT
jgi:hypothetical protein